VRSRLPPVGEANDHRSALALLVHKGPPGQNQQRADILGVGPIGEGGGLDKTEGLENPLGWEPHSTVRVKDKGIGLRLFLFKKPQRIRFVLQPVPDESHAF